MVQHHVQLPGPRGHDRVTTTDASVNLSGWYIRLYTIRYGMTNTHAYSKTGRPGPLGPVRGFGVSVENPDGITVFTHETRNEDEARSLFAAKLADDLRGEGYDE